MKAPIFIFFNLLTFIFCLATVNAQFPPPPAGGYPEWFFQIDLNQDEALDRDEYLSAAGAFFNRYDADADGILETAELPVPPPPGEMGAPRRNDRPSERDGRPPHRNRQTPNFVPPFLFIKINQTDLTREAFDKKIAQNFEQIDRNRDGRIDFPEIEVIDPRRQPRPGADEPSRRQGPPTAEFLGAEMRFGDRLVKNAPFSADIVTENNRRLFDGSLVTKQSKGAVYRDAAGRTRREQTLDSIGSISIAEPQALVFINDFVGKTHYFVDVMHKSARLQPLPDERGPEPDAGPKNGKTESLGTKIMEGVRVEGIKTVFEIPVGQLGNTIPIRIVIEKWFSPDLQVTVMSRLVDPLAGEQIFRLVNIRPGEPAADLFTVPKDFKMVKE